VKSEQKKSALRLKKKSLDDDFQFEMAKADTIADVDESEEESPSHIN
jgi:hypothetical protein